MSRFVKLSALVLMMTGLLPAQGNAELGQIQRVYIMPMASGFDQYLANRLRAIASMRVVTDPLKADAYFTDRLGVSFEAKLDAFEEKARESAAQEKGKDLTKEEAASEQAQKSFKLASPNTSSIGRAKGTYFLVERRGRQVVWSVYRKPKDYQPKTLDAVAEKIVEALQKDISGKQ